MTNILGGAVAFPKCVDQIGENLDGEVDAKRFQSILRAATYEHTAY